jgi:hypothetical protein
MTATTLDLVKFRAQLQRRLANVESESELLQQHATPWQRELLWRAALPIRLDEDTITAVLLDHLPGDDPGAMSRWLRQHPAFERDATAGLTLGVRASVRQEIVIAPIESATGPQEAERVRAHAGRLARHFVSRGPLWEFDGLSVLALSDPGRAAQRATRLFGQALRKADFTRAFHVLRTFEDRAPEIAALASGNHAWASAYQEFEKAVGELRRRYDSARAFAGDFERTTHVLERKAMLAEWRWLFKPPRARARSASRKARPTREQWILNVEARGGAGKSMLLRWLSARKCARYGVPYARIDFDFVDPRLTRGAAWYLLAQMARILDPQLPGRPLRSLVNRVDDVAPFGEYSIGPSEANRMLARLRSEVSSELGESVLEDLAQALDRSPASRIVLVLDTLEVALLHPDADVLALLHALKRLHDRCPKLRVILSGRFDLGSRLPRFDAEFGSRTRLLKLDNLSDSESIEYLTRRRGMKDGPVVQAIVEQCEGLPFALSLFADEWQLNPRLTASDVRETAGPKLLYLVQRVLKRVPPIIAWLVRYGAVARRLTKTFMSDVIVPELEELRRGKRYDNPLPKEGIVAQYYDKAKLALGVEALSADLLWKDLEDHASAFSFISRDSTVPNCLVLHPEVLEPMREELKNRRVFRRLNRRAMELALTRAGALDAGSDDDWAAAMDDALFYALRASEAKARRIWHDARETASRQAAFAAIALIATQLLDEKVDVPVQLRVEGARIRTEALIAVGVRRLSDGSEWDQARQARLVWRRVLRQARARTDAAYHVAGVRIASRTGQAPGSGLRALERLIRSTRRPPERLELHAALVEGYAHRPAALKHVAAARALLDAGRHNWGPSSVQRFKQLACAELARHGDNESALPLAQEVVAGMRHLALDEQVSAVATLIHLLTNCGALSRVQGALSRAAGLDAAIVRDGIIQDASAFEARVWLRSEVLRAHAFGGPPPPPPLPINSDTDPALRAVQIIGDAACLASSLESAGALALLQEARGLAGSGNVEVAARSLIFAATHYALILGDRRQARELVNESQSLTLVEGSMEWWMVNYLTTCLDAPASRFAIKRLALYNRRRPTAWGSLIVELTGVSAGRRSVVAARDLLSALRRIRPVAAARRHLAESLPGIGRPSVPDVIAPAIATALNVDGRYATQPRGSGIGQTIERWIVCDLLGTPYRADASAWRDRGCLDLARWTCATQGEWPPTDFDEARLNEPAVPDLARGIAHYARASAIAATRPERARELAQRAHDILSGPSVPANVWLARTDLLRCRLDSGDRRARESALLFVEELAERLDAPRELAQARQLRKSKVEESARPHIVALRMTSTIGRSSRSPILRAIREDARGRTSYRMPDRVTKELASRFAAAVRDLGRKVLPEVEGPPGSSVRLAFVTAEPAIAALPLELALARREARERGHGQRTLIAPGWRALEDPRDSANEHWALRVFDWLKVDTADASGIKGLTRRFQASRHLPQSGLLDATTLRSMVRAIRNDQPPSVALVLASGNAMWQRGHKIMEAAYASDSANLTVLVGESRNTLRTLASGDHDVIHIVAPLVESSSFGGLAFNLTPGDAEMTKGGSREYLAVSELVSAIKRSRPLLRPVIVVQNSLSDLPQYETARQFTLRNVVAMELFRSGGPVATVAMSASPERGEASTATAALIDVLLAGKPLGNFLERLESPSVATRRYTVHDAAEMAQELQRYSPCIFANNPDHIVV